MPLTKKPTMTTKRIAANQANGRLSHGPATPEGRERIRAANTRHGFYSQAESVALTCLGEDPAELERLRNDLQGDVQPLSALEKELKEHLVEVVWRWKRAGRGQEGFALRLAKDANLTRDDRLHAQMMRLKITAETLRRLAQSVAREDYFTPREDLEIMKSLHQEGAVREIGEIALALFCQLRKPGTDEDGLDPEESARRVVAQVKAIFGIGMRAEFAPQASIAADSSQPQDCQQVRIQDSDGVHRTSEIGAAGAAEAEEDEPDDMSPEEVAHERARQLLENTAGGALRGAAPGHPEGLPSGSVALRTRCGNRARTPRRGADAEDGRIQLSPNLADCHPAPQD